MSMSKSSIESLANNFTNSESLIKPESIESNQVKTTAVSPSNLVPSNNTCQFCNHSFSSAGKLSRHQLTAKYCLAIQNKIPEQIYKCKFCDYSTPLKDKLKRHQQICKSKTEDDNIRDKCRQLELDLAIEKGKVEELRESKNDFKKIASQPRIQKNLN